MKKVLGIIAWLFIASGTLIIVLLRAHGIDLTEGQLLIKYAPYWILAAGLILGGIAIHSNIIDT